MPRGSMPRAATGSREAISTRRARTCRGSASSRTTARDHRRPMAASDDRRARRSEVAGLGEALAAGGIGHVEGVAGGRVRRARAAALRGEDAVVACAESLPRAERVLVGHGGRGAAVALGDLATDGVVLAGEADAGGPLHADRDAERGEARRAADLELLLVEPGA